MFATDSAEAVSVNNIFPSTIISDAFETVTNGMHNPEALEKLRKTGPSEPDWLNTILAIQAFYAQDFTMMDQLLNSVSGDSIPGKLKQVLYHMSGTGNVEDRLSRLEIRLSRRITEDSRFLSSAIDQLKESIEYGEILFTETASLLIKEIRKNPGAAESLALWSFRTCIEHGFDDEPLADNIMMLFGQAEGLRLIGLSLIEQEPDSALICFIRSLIKKLVDRSSTEEEAAAFLEIIEALISACDDGNPVLIDISEMLSMLESELGIYFSLEPRMIPADPAERIAGMIAAIRCEGPPKAAPEVSPAVKTASPRRREAVQLELF